MIDDFKIVLCCLTVVCFAVMFYLAGRGNFFELAPKILLDRLEELNRKHGEWIIDTVTYNDEFVDYGKCSVCGNSAPIEYLPPYCCECGAKMDQKEGAEE